MSCRLGDFPLGDIVTGQVVKIDPRGVLVDFGVGQPAYVPLPELSLVEIQTPHEILQLNEIREFLVVGNYDGEYDFFFSDCSPETLNDSDRLYVIAANRASLQYEHPVSQDELIVHTKILAVYPNGVLAKIQWFFHSEHPPTITFSIRRSEMQTAWKRVRQLQAEDATLYSKIFKKTEYSAIVKIEGLQGFVDNVDRCRGKLVVGEELPLKILEAKEEFNRLRLIQCSALIKLRQLRAGQAVIGIVQAVKAYGVFIDVGGLYALLPTSKIVPTVDHPGQIFKVNDSLKAIIAEINLEEAQISLERWEKLA